MRQKGDFHWSRRQPDRVRRGTDSHASVLSPRDIDAICEDWTRNHPRKTWLARKHGVNRVTIYRHLKARGLI